MKMFKKLKDVLFDVEEDDLPTLTKEEVVKEEPKYKEENTIKEIKIPEEERLESTFNFPMDFDDEPIRTREKTYLEDTRDYMDVFEKKETKPNNTPRVKNFLTEEKEETKPFKTSPIISPVYGILDKNYTKDDIIVKTDIGVKGPNLEEVRKKAYGIEEKKKKEEQVKKTDELKTLDEILMEEPDIPMPKVKEEVNIEEDTLETDLFNLIDSMYEDEEGEV